MIGFGYRLYRSYNGYNGIRGKGIDKMIDQLIAKHDELPALPTEMTERRLLFFHRGVGGAPESVVDRQAVVILPDHLHCIWTLPLGDDDFSNRWRQIKAAFSRQLPKIERRSKSRVNQGERGIWQRRFWEQAIRDEADYRHHMDYLHYNPGKHGYVTRVADWPFSSFHRFVRLGMYPSDWGGSGLRDMVWWAWNDGFRCALPTLHNYINYEE